MLLAWWLAIFCAPLAIAQQVDFQTSIQPIFRQHCYACHSSRKANGNLRLDIKSLAFRGGENFGPGIVPADVDASPVVRFSCDEQAELAMPPKGPGLLDEQKQALQRWVREGAVWPDGVDDGVVFDPAQHWAFQPLANPAIPAVAHDPQNPIDHFVFHKLEAMGLAPSPPATRAAWLRRVYFDLIGLPPTPDALQSFLKDIRPNAFEEVVEQLLRSPHYGERWAQHWLDVVRYADTHGFEVNTERPFAWPYRDYVIQAFNHDIPYDQFIRHQIAGDQISADQLDADAATGFLVTASVLLPGQIGQDEPSKRLARQDALDEIVVNTAQTFLGLSVGCARCHDHKFDPISARDYYAMQAFFAGVEYGDRDWKSPANERKRQEIAQLKTRFAELMRNIQAEPALAEIDATGKRPMISARKNLDQFQPVTTTKLRFVIEATNQLEPCIDEIEVFNVENQNVAIATSGATITTSGQNLAPNRHELRFVNDGEYGNSRSWMSNEVGKGWLEIEFKENQTIDRVVWGRDRLREYRDRLATAYRIEVLDADGNWSTVSDHHDRIPFVEPTDPSTLDQAAPMTEIELQAQQLQKQIATLSEGLQAFIGVFRQPDTIHVLHRGDPEQPLEQIDADVPTFFHARSPSVRPLVPDLSMPMGEADRRLALADWIANPENPLTARVMVNRIWQGHFGVGLVDTPSDFGSMGSKPSHPELLDWLAKEFIRSGWSIKHLHRLIVLSATYRQSTSPNQKATGIDADARWLWRYPLRRLDAESIRDSMLAVSGRLNSMMGGRGFDLFDKRGGLTGFTPIDSFREEGLRRMIYAHRVRRERDGVFGSFDCPDAGQSTARRKDSTTPIQALSLFNSRFTWEQSHALAERIQCEVSASPSQDTTHREEVLQAFWLTLGRPATEHEVAAALPLVQEQGIAMLCRALFNSNEYLYLP